MSPGWINLIIFPKYETIHYNSYYRLLYGDISRGKGSAELSLSSNYLQIIGPVLSRRNLLLHIHWFEPNSFADLIKYSVLMCTLLLFRLFSKRHLRIVFTPHNIKPHGNHLPRPIYLLRYGLIRMADCVFVHCQRERDVLRRYFKVTDLQKVEVLAHPAYPKIPEEALPEPLKSQIGDRQYLLSFGQIAPYKNFEMLVKAFDQVYGSADSVLVIAARGYFEKLERLRSDKVIIHNGYLSDGQLATLIKRSKACVFSYKRIMTSGAVIHAISLGKETIAPHKGCLPEIDGRGLITYDGHSGLCNALYDLKRRKRPLRVSLSERHDEGIIKNSLYQKYLSLFE
jgi:beta-1,4-mannosyltransferase